MARSSQIDKFITQRQRREGVLPGQFTTGSNHRSVSKSRNAGLDSSHRSGQRCSVAFEPNECHMGLRHRKSCHNRTSPLWKSLSGHSIGKHVAVQWLRVVASRWTAVFGCMSAGFREDFVSANPTYTAGNARTPTRQHRCERASGCSSCKPPSSVGGRRIVQSRGTA
jgi:hypothetical protein